jgi:hypothetical protein
MSGGFQSYFQLFHCRCYPLWISLVVQVTTTMMMSCYDVTYFHQQAAAKNHSRRVLQMANYATVWPSKRPNKWRKQKLQ